MLRLAIETDALSRVSLRLARDCEANEVAEAFETDRSLRLASEADTWALRLSAESEAALRLSMDVEYSDNELADKEPADSLSQLLRSLRL